MKGRGERMVTCADKRALSSLAKASLVKAFSTSISGRNDSDIWGD